MSVSVGSTHRHGWGLITVRSNNGRYTTGADRRLVDGGVGE